LSLQIQFDSTLSGIPLNIAPQESNWYAVHTRPRHEKRVAQLLEEKRVCTFLPLLQQIHKWSDRRRSVEVPMFGNYAFVRIAQTAAERLNVLRTPGILAFVGSEGHGTPIPDEQIESLQKAIREKLPCTEHPFISVGQRVRIRGGSLNGIEGILMSKGGEQSVIVSVELLQRSVAIRVDGYGVELA
jgi:transcription antitermination factor NusG